MWHDEMSRPRRWSTCILQGKSSKWPAEHEALLAARFLQRPLAKLISTLRAPKSSEGYKAIGGGSPLRRITEEQADALAQSLKGRGLEAKVYVGMRYWTPFIDDAMEQASLHC